VKILSIYNGMYRTNNCSNWFVVTTSQFGKVQHAVGDGSLLLAVVTY